MQSWLVHPHRAGDQSRPESARKCKVSAGCRYLRSSLVNSSAMRRMTLGVRVGAAVAAGLARAVVRRLRMGPTPPSWTWAEDLFVAVYRAALTTASHDVGLMAPRGRGLQLPLRRDFRRRLAVSTEDLGGVRAERYRPFEERWGTILYFHGGGFVTGSPGLERQVAGERACTLRCDTWNVSYRLAPRHPFPAALDDGVTAYQSLLARGAEPATPLYGGRPVPVWRSPRL